MKHAKLIPRAEPTMPQVLAVPGLDEIGLESETPDQKDPHFKSELAYEGYENIVDSDNDAYSLNAEDNDDPEKELDFSGRPEDSSNVEESLVDTQENHKKLNPPTI